ncbi:MAG TPA: hypothetical protein VL053_05695 [Arachidicoccus sp.]|nr:hypothetical protein [Arachidicoccus sp.]
MGKHENSSKSPVDRIVTAYIQLEKYGELEALLQDGGCSSISGLLRYMVKNRKVITKKCDNTLDKLMFVLSGIRTELYFMDLNINVIRKGLDGLEWPEAKRAGKQEVVEMFHQGGRNISPLFNLITKLSYVWLPE